MWLIEDESSRTIAHEDRFEQKLSLVYSINQIVLNVDKAKTVSHKYYIENYPKPFANEIQNETETSRSKCLKLLMIIVDFIRIQCY